VDRLSTADLLQALTDDDLKPWATYNRGRPMTPRQLAKRLDEYGIQPRTIRAGYGTAKGFTLDRFGDAFARYLSPTTTTENIRHTSQPSNHDGFSVTANSPVTSHVTKHEAVTDNGNCDGTQNQSVTPRAASIKDCDGVTDKTGEPCGGAVEVEL
jgi:putative DNA primase/helicase